MLSSNQVTPRVLNRRHLHGAVANSAYIGRPSIWGNPFVIGKDGTREQVIASYEMWLAQQPELVAKLGELTLKRLICWRAPARCHGDVPLRLANDGRHGDG